MQILSTHSDERPSINPEETECENDIVDIQILVNIKVVCHTHVRSIEIWFDIALDMIGLRINNVVEEDPAVPETMVANWIKIIDCEVNRDINVLFVFHYLPPKILDIITRKDRSAQSLLAQNHRVQVF